MRFMCGLQEFFVGRVEFTVPDVISHSRVEQNDVLADEGDLISPPGQVEFGQRDFVDQYAS